MKQLHFILFIALGLSACSSSDDSTPDAGERPDSSVSDNDADASDDAAADAGEEYLGLTQPENGFQLRSLGTTIPAGEDLEFCEIAELPGDPSDTYYVKSIEFANGELSHHLIVTAPEPGGVADQMVRELDIGDQVPCLSGQQAFGEVDHPSVGGIQQPYGRVDFPEGVGRVFHGGQRIVFDFHYNNYTTEPVEARSAINFHLTDADSVKHIASGFAFNNWTIDTPSGTSKSFKAECTFNQDVMVAELTRHTHRWGTDFSIWYEGGDQDGEHLWTSVDWQHDIDYTFEEPRLVKAGEGFAFECSYNNEEDRALRFGTNATDEMCILFGLIWGAGDEREVPSQDCDVIWVDDDGVGHTAEGGGGIPEPSENDRALCASGSTEPTECDTCQCDNCATPIMSCYFDPECKPLLDCFGTPDCDAQAIIDQYSSGLGMLQQITFCLESKCSMCN